MKNKIFVGALFVLLLSISGLANAGSFQTRKPFDEAEFNRFMTDYPAFAQWLAKKSLYQDSKGNPWIMSGMRYNRTFLKQLQGKGWDAERFFYLLDHINMGLLTSQAEAKRDASRAILDKQRKKMQARMTARQTKFQKQMQEQIRSSSETAQRQWAAQRKRIENNPYMPPRQKQWVLKQLDRSQPSSEKDFTVPSSEAWQAQMRAQQQASMEEQKRRIMNNPTIPPYQKRTILAQMQRSMAFAKTAQQRQQRQQKQQQQRASLTPAEMRAKSQARQAQWIETQMQEVRDNPAIHPIQKQQILGNLQQSLSQTKKSAAWNQDAGTLIPSQENNLIKNNRLKLMELFFPET